MTIVRASDAMLRELRTHEEYLACVALQEHTWGRGFTERVPPSILMISQKMGGIAAGAFDPSGRMLGFVYGITGLKDGELAHWSHMLGVLEESRGLGLGRRLKLYQRDVLLSRGIGVCYWTFDPLVARNANLNLNRLGARIAKYIENLYGPDTESELHSGLGTDRFVVEWRLAAPEVEAAIAAPRVGKQLPEGAPIVNAEPSDAGGDTPRQRPLPDAAGVRVEVPPDIYALLHRDRALAWQWRVASRRAFLWYLSHGYRVTGFGEADGRSCYLLER